MAQQQKAHSLFAKTLLEMQDKINDFLEEQKGPYGQHLIKIDCLSHSSYFCPIMGKTTHSAILIYHDK